MKKILKVFVIFILLYGCSSIKLEPVNFGWPIENVLEIRGDFNVTSMRYALTLNLRKVFDEENLITNGEPLVKQVRIIRNNDGYYFIVAEKFKHVYVFAPDQKSLVLKNKLLINETGIKKPAFNQRDDYIELVTEKEKYKLTQNGFYNNR